MAVLAEQKDHLTSLTPELQHMIFSYLLPSHEPDKALEGADTKPGRDEKKPRTHPLDFLAATSKALRDEVNEWALHFLAQHREITKYKPLKAKSRQESRDFLRSRNGLLNWVERHCVFCGNKSSRSAILMNGLRCCMKCDREQWLDKITKTEARMKYDLKDEHLLPSSLNSPTAAKLLQKHPGLPKVRYGTYITSNVPTTMFLRKDVEALAKLAHGDLREHLAKKQADRDERRKKARETKARKDAEALAAKEKQNRLDYADEMWVYRHKHHSITSYGNEAGLSTPPQSMTKSSNTTNACSKKAKKHKKTLSIDSDVANEGRVITPSPPREPSPAISPRVAGIVRAPSYSVWEDLPSMFGMDEAEWDALCKEQFPPTPPKPTLETKSNFEALERLGKSNGGKVLDVEVFEQERAWRKQGVDRMLTRAL